MSFRILNQSSYRLLPPLTIATKRPARHCNLHHVSSATTETNPDGVPAENGTPSVQKGSTYTNYALTTMAATLTLLTGIIFYDYVGIRGGILTVLRPTSDDSRITGITIRKGHEIIHALEEEERQLVKDYKERTKEDMPLE